MARCTIGEFSCVPGVIPASSRIVVLATRLLPEIAIESGVAHLASGGRVLGQQRHGPRRTSASCGEGEFAHSMVI